MKNHEHKQRQRSRWWLLCASLMVVLVAGCQQKMADQPSFKPLEPSKFFEDGRASRPLVASTVARGHLRVDPSFYSGRIGSSQPGVPNTNTATSAADNDNKNQTAVAAPRAPGDTVGRFVENARFVEKIPIPINESVLNYGYQRYMIYCVVCHDPLGTGHGKIIERGYTAPPSFHIDRLRNAPVGRLFAVATEGYGSMPAYAAQIPTEDRWAIIAYVKALQLSQHFPVTELTPAMNTALTSATVSPSANGEHTSEDAR